MKWYLEVFKLPEVRGKKKEWNSPDFFYIWFLSLLAKNIYTNDDD
jgi:hypothetical protein